jgi:excisionase family DNA binding protein
LTLEDLRSLVAQAPREELPAIVGALAAAQAEALARLAAPLPAPVAPVGDKPDANISVEEAARQLGMSDRWVYRKAKSLPFVRRIGRRVVCSARDLAEWNARQRP